MLATVLLMWVVPRSAGQGDWHCRSTEPGAQKRCLVVGITGMLGFYSAANPLSPIGGQLVK